MSTEAVQEFLGKVAEDDELLASLEGMSPEDVEAVGAEHGLEFGADELTAALAGDELDDDDLDEVAGGVNISAKAMGGPARSLKFGGLTSSRLQHIQGHLPWLLKNKMPG